MAIEKVRVALADRHLRDRWIGIYIGVVAVLLAVCATGGGNATKDATRANIEATNTWNFFQAKNARRNALRLTIDTLELQASTQPGLDAAGRAAFAARIKEYRELDAALTSDLKSNEGLDQLFVRGKALEKERDIALRRDPYFDWAQALLQIAIVLATVCLVLGSFWLFVFSAAMAALGTLLMLNGATLMVALPVLG